MEPRLSLVTLGVKDVAAARRFYEAVGFKAAPVSNENVAFIDAGGVIISLFGRKDLADDAHVEDTPTGFSAIALAHNTRSEAEVDHVLAEAVASGARLLKPGQKVFWGGYAGHFADPDGHIWEVAYNPFFPFDEAGRIDLSAVKSAGDAA